MAHSFFLFFLGGSKMWHPFVVNKLVSIWLISKITHNKSMCKWSQLVSTSKGACKISQPLYGHFVWKSYWISAWLQFNLSTDELVLDYNYAGRLRWAPSQLLQHRLTKLSILLEVASCQYGIMRICFAESYDSDTDW